MEKRLQVLTETMFLPRCRKPASTWRDGQYHSPPGKCKSKPQWKLTSHPLEQPWWKRQTLPSVGKDAEELDPGTGGAGNWPAALENLLAVPPKVNHITQPPNPWPSTPPHPAYIHTYVDTQPMTATCPQRLSTQPWSRLHPALPSEAHHSGNQRLFRGDLSFWFCFKIF